jgi:anaerobic selenocysteine-containing dehydrogenase
MTEETRIPGFCAQCRSRCGCDAVVKNGRLLRIEPLPDHPSGEKLCPKGKAAAELVYHPDRLTQPMRRTSPKGAAKATWAAITWQEALNEIAGRMNDIRAKHGAEQVAFSVTTPSGTQISDSIAWIERLIRAYGSPNTIYGTEICNWHKDFASKFTYGTDIGTPDFANTDCVLLWGNNPAATWLARSVEVQKAVKRGAKLIVIDPRPTLFARRADSWLRVKPGTDQVLALGLANQLIQSKRFDADFVRQWSNGPLLVCSDTGAFLRQSDVLEAGDENIMLAGANVGDDLLRYDVAKGQWLDDVDQADLSAVRTVQAKDGAIECQSAFGIFAAAAAALSPDKVAKITGVSETDLQQAAELLADSATTAYYAWNGVGQSITATQTDRAISTLYALTGSYGRKGGNVPGAAAAFGDISGQDLLSNEQRAKAVGLDERPIGPGRSGWVTARDVYKAIVDQTPYPVRMLVSFGGNMLAAQPDTDQARKALEALEFHVHADFFLNPTSEYADIILPVASSWEREALRTGFDASLEGLRHVQLRPAVIEPVGEARSDTDIALGLAQLLGLSDTFFQGDTDRGHNQVLEPVGLSVNELRAEPAGMKLPSTVTYSAHAQSGDDQVPIGFPTPTKKVEIYSEQLHVNGYDPVPIVRSDDILKDRTTFPLQLSCAKTVAFCHSQHRNLPSLRRLMPDPILEMPPASAVARGIADMEWVQIRTRVGSFVARCKIVKDLEPGSVFAQHGWWIEGEDASPYGADNPMAANMNTVVDTTLSDPISGSIPLRCSDCEVEKLEQAVPAE